MSDVRKRQTLEYQRGYKDAKRVYEQRWIPLNVDAVKAQPTADVIEVVRCKDCKWYGYLTCSNPEGPKGWVTDECFCGFAERRNDE